MCRMCHVTSSTAIAQANPYDHDARRASHNHNAQKLVQTVSVLRGKGETTGQVCAAVWRARAVRPAAEPIGCPVCVPLCSHPHASLND